MNIVLRFVLRVAITILMMAFGGRAGAAAPPDPSGTWLVQDGRARIRLERCGPSRDRICGFIVWMKEPADKRGQPYRDKENPDPDKRARALLGHQLILGLQATPGGTVCRRDLQCRGRQILFGLAVARRSRSPQAQGLPDQVPVPDPDLAADPRRAARPARRPHRRSQRPPRRQGMGRRAGTKADTGQSKITAASPDLIRIKA
ncbi:hypothetical protein ABIF62_001544 [Bradyrhizobium japonicum]